MLVVGKKKLRNEKDKENNIHADVFAAHDHLDVKIAWHRSWSIFQIN